MKNFSVKILAMLMLAVFAAATLFGCGAKSDYSYHTSSNEMAYDSNSIDLYEIPEAGEYAMDSLTDYTEAAPAEKPESNDNKIERKIIKNAYIDMEAENANECYQSLLGYAKQLGGYESSCQSKINDYGDKKYIYITAQLRLPPDKLESFVSKTGELGEVTYSDISQDEITEAYYDLSTRLASKNAALGSYYGLLEKAETIEDILEIQTRIDQITEEIEAIKGKLRVYDSLVDESTVNLSITERCTTPAAEKEFEWDSLSLADFGKLIKNGFLGVCNFVWSLLQWVAIILISIIPILVIAGVVFIIVRAIRKKLGITSKKSKKSPKAEKTDEKVEKINPAVYNNSEK